VDGKLGGVVGMGLVVGERPLATKTRYLRLSTSFSELEPRSLHARSHLYSSFSPAYYLSPLPGKVFSEEGRTTSLLPRYPEEHETMIHSVNDESAHDEFIDTDDLARGGGETDGEEILHDVRLVETKPELSGSPSIMYRKVY
jgi:hypothetical protein